MNNCPCCGKFHPNEQMIRLVKLVGQDKTNAEIGFLVNRSQFTIRNQLTLAMQEYGAASRLGLVLRMLKHGLLNLDELLPASA